MFRRMLPILSIILILIVHRASAAVNITCSFAMEDGTYVARLFSQSYKLSDRGMKIYGKHAHGNSNQNVRILDASHKKNSLEIVPSTLLRIFTGLKVALFEDIGLKEMTVDSLKYCKNIEEMRFAKDAIKIGPGCFRACSKLERLEFRGNNLNDIDTDAFLGLEYLRVLVLDNVGISSVFVLLQLLKPLKRLQEIHLTNNKLTLYPVLALEHMALLKKINMSNNQIDVVTNLYIKNKHHLEVLDMSNNKVETIERTILENWQNRAAFNLTNNVCIDENFETIGTEENPMIKIAAALEPCFNDIKMSGHVSTKADSAEDESASKEKTLAKKKTLSDSEIVQKLLDSERKATLAINKTVTEEKKKEAGGGMTGSPFDFVKVNATDAPVVNGSSSTKKSSDEESGSEETTVSTTTTTTTTTTEQPETTAEGKKKKKKKRTKKGKKMGLVDAEVALTTEAPAEPKKPEEKPKESFADVLKKKLVNDTVDAPKKAVNVNATDAPKKIEVTEAPKKIEVTEAPKKSEVTEAPKKSEVTEAPKKTEEKTPEVPPSKKHPSVLHDYEQANARIYLNADKEYHCIVENATPEVKQINVVHLVNHTNEHVTSIFFRNSTLSHVPKNLIALFPNTVYLSIERTRINAMTNDFIENCGKVTRIDVKHNNVRYLEKDALKSCKSLTEVDLSFNPLKTIESGVFESNPGLKIVFNDLEISPGHYKGEEHAEKKGEVKENPQNVTEGGKKKEVKVPNTQQGNKIEETPPKKDVVVPQVNVPSSPQKTKSAIKKKKVDEVGEGESEEVKAQNGVEEKKTQAEKPRPAIKVSDVAEMPEKAADVKVEGKSEKVDVEQKKNVKEVVIPVETKETTKNAVEKPVDDKKNAEKPTDKKKKESSSASGEDGSEEKSVKAKSKQKEENEEKKKKEGFADKMMGFFGVR